MFLSVTFVFITLHTYGMMRFGMIYKGKCQTATPHQLLTIIKNDGFIADLLCNMVRLGSSKFCNIRALVSRLFSN